MIPRLLKVCLVCSVFTVPLQARQQGGQGTQTPTPAPAPQPANPPRQPSPAPQPSPVPANQTITIRGRIITNGAQLPVSQLEVRFETDGGQPLGFAYADDSGQFTFQQSGLNMEQSLYVVVQLEGY